jgi:hypothetical protein
MGSITAGQDFGQQVAQPRRLNEVATPRAAFGSSDSLVNIGRQMEVEGRHAENEAQREAKQARERADAAVAQSKLYGMRDQLGDLVGEIGEGVKTGQIDKTQAAQQWQERSAKVIEDGLGGVPDAHRGLAQTDLQGLSQRLTSDVGKAVRERDKHDTMSGISATLEYTQRMAVQDPAKARAIMSDTLDQLGPFAGLQPDQITKAKQGWVEGTAYTRAFSAVAAARTDNKALSVVEKSLEGNQDLDPQRRVTLLAQVDNYRASNEARAIRQAQHAEIVAARRERESTSAFTVLSGWALAGKVANPDASAGLIGKLTPEHAAAYKAMAAEVPARTAAAMLPLDQQQAQIDQLKAHINKSGTSVMAEQELNRRQQVLTEAKREYADEPLRAGAERGVIDTVAPLNLSSLDAMVTGLAARVDQAQTVATRTRRPVSPLLGDEAVKVGEVLNSMPPAQRSQRIAQLASMLPPGMAQALAAQIDQKDKGLALEIAAGSTKTNAGRFTSEWIARGRQAIKDKSIKEDSAATTGLRASIAAEIGDSLTGKARDSVIEAARLMSLGLQAGGVSHNTKDVVGMAVGGAIIEHNGKRIPVPAGIADESALRQKLRATPLDAVRAQLPDGMVYLPGGKPMAAADFMARLPDAQLEPAGQGRYMVRSGGSLVMSAEARPVLIEVR